MQTITKAKVNDFTQMIEVDVVLTEKDKDKKDQIVHHFKHGFPLETPKEAIEKEIAKARNLFIKEREQMKLQRVVDKKFENAQKVVKHFNK